MKRKVMEENKSTREGFGEGLIEVGEKNPDVVVLTADLRDSTKVSKFAKKFPNRFFDAGVAEQSLVTIASGMANYGKIPVVTSFAVFVPGRCLEQIRTTIAINNFPVIIVGSHTGFSAGLDGATHQALEDIATMRTIPNMTVVTPCDFYEAKKAIVEAVSLGGPVYLRLERDATPIITKEDSKFKIGKIDTLKDVKDPQVALIATGPILSEVLTAASRLEKNGISSLVLNCHTIKPLDTQAIIHAAKIAGAVVTIEVHQKAGGLGSAVTELLSQNFPIPVGIVGVRDLFGESGKPDELLKKHGLTAEGIIKKVKEVITRKNN
jgi:transketolase